MFGKLKTVVLFLRLCIFLLLSRPFGSIIHDWAAKNNVSISISDLPKFEKIPIKTRKSRVVFNIPMELQVFQCLSTSFPNFFVSTWPLKSTARHPWNHKPAAEKCYQQMLQGTTQAAPWERQTKRTHSWITRQIGLLHCEQVYWSQCEKSGERCHQNPWKETSKTYEESGSSFHIRWSCH